MAISFDGSEFAAIDSDQDDRPADSLLAFSLVNNLRNIGSDQPAKSSVPAYDASGGEPDESYLTSLRWATIYAQRMTVQRRTTDIECGILREVGDFTTTSVSDYGDFRLKVTSSEGDVLLSDPVGAGSDEFITEKSVSVTPDLQTPAPVDVIVELQWRSQYIEVEQDPGDIVGVSRGMIGYVDGQSLPREQDEVFRVERTEGRPPVTVDYLSESSDSDRAHVMLESIPEGDHGNVRQGIATFVRPLAVWMRTISDSPTTIRDEALTHNRPLAAQSSIFRMARETQTRYQRPRPLSLESEGDQSDTLDDEPVINAASGEVIVERTGCMLNMTSDSDQNGEVEWRLALFCYYVLEDWVPESSTPVDTLLDDAGTITFDLEMRAQQLKEDDDWSGATLLASDTRTYDEVPLIPAPIATWVPFLQSQLTDNDLRGGCLYSEDLNARLVEYLTPRLEIDESSLIEKFPVSIDVSLAVTSFTAPGPESSGKTDADAQIASLFANPYWVPQ